MDPFTIALVGGLALSAVGTFMQADASSHLADAQKNVLGEQQKQETIRERAMELDARRRKREVIRQGIIANSQALATATNQGAQLGSGLQGAYGQIQGQQNWTLSGIDSSLGFGKEMFASNRQMLDYRKDEASAGASAAIGAGISSIGGKVAGNAKSFDNLFGNN